MKKTKERKGIGIATIAALGLGWWILTKLKAPPSPGKVFYPYLAPSETPTYLLQIRKSYYDDLYQRGEMRWQKAANQFWAATEKVTNSNDIYPAYEDAYASAVV